jgi:pimeloyl-ACP methyl ester carboxylesterase
LKFYLTVLSRFLKFIFFPGLVSFKPYLETGQEFVHIDFKEKGLPLVVSFSGLGQEFNFRATLAAYRVNVIYFRDLKHHWYLTALPGAGNNTYERVNFIKGLIAEYAPSRVVTIGVSAGGFGSLLYGSLLDADHIIAFSPQTFMNRLNVIFKFDYRWLDRIVEIYHAKETDRSLLDLKRVIAGNKMPIEIIFDSQHRLDRIHAERLRGKQIYHSRIKGGGHNVVKQLRDNGQLKKLLDRALLNTSNE